MMFRRPGSRRNVTGQVQRSPGAWFGADQGLTSDFEWDAAQQAFLRSHLARTEDDWKEHWSFGAALNRDAMVERVLHADAELVIAARSGSVDAFAQLVERYQGLVRSIAYARTGSWQ